MSKDKCRTFKIGTNGLDSETISVMTVFGIRTNENCIQFNEASKRRLSMVFNMCFGKMIQALTVTSSLLNICISEPCVMATGWWKYSDLYNKRYKMSISMNVK